MSEDQSENEDLELQDFSEDGKSSETDIQPKNDQKHLEDLEAVFDVPVKISAILGRTNVEISDLLSLNTGDILELDRKVGEAIDLYVNNRLIARGEVVLVDDKLGVTMTEIINKKKD